VISQTILFIEWHRSKNERSEMNYWLEYLRMLLVNDIQAQ
jgi:hypothetical protein